MDAHDYRKTTSNEDKIIACHVVRISIICF